MSNNPLSGLKIRKAPKAFIEMAIMHNALVDYVASIEGGDGLQVDHAAPTRAQLLKSGKKTMRGKMRVGAAPGTRIGNLVTPHAVEIVAKGDDGKLVGVHAVPAYIEKNYPQYAQVGELADNNVQIFAGLVRVNNSASGKILTIDYSLLTHDMDIVEIDVCSNGAPKKMLVVASAPY